MVGYGSDAVFIENNNFSRAYITDKFRSHRVKGTAFGGDNVPAVGRFAVAKGTEAVFVPYCNKLGGGHYNKGICAPYLVHRLIYRLLD